MKARKKKRIQTLEANIWNVRAESLNPPCMGTFIIINRKKTTDTVMNAFPKALDIRLPGQNRGRVDGPQEADELRNEDGLQEEANDVDDQRDDSEIVQQVDAIEHWNGLSKEGLVDALDAFV